MAKTGYKIDYIVRNIGDDLSDLIDIHREVFPGNELAIWKKDKQIIVKVSNFNKIIGDTLKDAKTKIGYIEKVI